MLIEKMSTESEYDYTSGKYYPKWDGTRPKWPRFRDDFMSMVACHSTKYGRYYTILKNDNIKILKPQQISTAATEEERKEEEKVEASRH